jgi:hypothetical protein
MHSSPPRAAFYSSGQHPIVRSVPAEQHHGEMIHYSTVPVNGFAQAPAVNETPNPTCLSSPGAFCTLALSPPQPSTISPEASNPQPYTLKPQTFLASFNLHPEHCARQALNPETPKQTLNRRRRAAGS